MLNLGGWGGAVNLMILVFKKLDKHESVRLGTGPASLQPPGMIRTCQYPCGKSLLFNKPDKHERVGLGPESFHPFQCLCGKSLVLSSLTNMTNGEFDLNL